MALWVLLYFVVAVPIGIYVGVNYERLTGRSPKGLSQREVLALPVKKKGAASPFPEKTALEAMREAGLVIHEEGAAPRRDLIGHFFVKPDILKKCTTCANQEEFGLLKIVQDFSQDHVRCGVSVRAVRVATVCNKCGLLYVVEPFTFWENGPMLVRTGHLAQNVFDHLSEIPIEDEETEEGAPKLTRAQLDEKIGGLELALNEARLQKLKLEHHDGVGQSAEPYRGGEETKKLH